MKKYRPSRKTVVTLAVIKIIIGMGFIGFGIFVWEGIDGLAPGFVGGLFIAHALVDLDFEFNINPPDGNNL